MEINKIYLVTWRDHFHTDGWIEFKESDIIDSDVLVDTVGFFVGEDKHYIHLSQSKSHEESGETNMNIMSILKRQIIKEQSF